MASADYVDLRRQDLGQTYRPQREWIEGRGLLLPTAHFFSGIGAGAWGLSLIFDVPAGRVLALVCVGVFSGLAHLLFLGRWQRFWRILRRPRTSWISRGLWGIGLFVIGGLGSLLPGTREGVLGQVMLGVSLAGMTIILLYEGFVYAASRAIPFWNTLLLPLLYVAYAVRGGAALLLVAASAGGAISGLDVMESVKLWVVASTGLLVLLYLASASSAGGAAGRSVRALVAGRISLAFYGGTIALGIVVPLGLGIARTVADLGLPLLGLVGLASLAGDFYVKYCIVKAGVYVPLRPEGPADAPLEGKA